MKTNKLRAVQIVALLISAVVTVWAMLNAAAWQIDFAAIALICLAISPYAVLYAVSVLLDRYTRLPKAALVCAVTAILMLAFTLPIYLLGTRGGGDASSTDALVFIFVPVWLYIGGFALLVVGLLAAWIIEKIGGKRKVAP